MAQHYIIESLPAYQAVKRATNGQPIWHTTSPYLLETLSKEGEEIYSLEQELNLDSVNDLGKASYRFSESVCEWLNRVCDWRGYLDFNTVLASSISQWIYVLLHKGKLLDDLLGRIQSNTNPRVICVGDPDHVQMSGVSLGYGRFDTLFAYIALHRNGDDVAVFRHVISSEILSEKHNRVMDRRMGTFEKTLSLLNNTCSSFLFKTWKNLVGKGMYPFGHVGIWPFSKRTFYIYKDCELLEEIFLKLLLAGGRVGRIRGLPKIDNALDSNDVSNPLMENLGVCQGLIRKKLLESGHRPDSTYETCGEVFSRRILRVVRRLQLNLPHLTKGFDEILRTISKSDLILTNGLATPIERLFYCFCKEKGVKVVAFDHGITLGLSEWSLWRAKQTSMLAADIGVYHDRCAVKAVEPYAGHQVKIEAGLPSVAYDTPLYSLQRFLVKKRLGIDNSRHVAMYVAEIEKNNYIGGPYVENDWQHLQKTKEIVSYLAEAFSDSLVILKLYPADRYLHTYEFDHLASKYDNLLIIKDIDYRYVRSAADVVFTSCPTSTLGWVLGSKSTCMYLEFDWVPCLFQGFEMKLDRIGGLKRMQLITKQQMVGKITGDVVKRLIASGTA